MKHWPLRWKVALYAAALAIAATLAGATTTWVWMRREQIAAFDRRLEIDAQELFRDAENFEGAQTRDRRTIKADFVPLALRERLVEVRADDGEVLYLSPNLRAPIPDDGIAGVHARIIDGKAVRLAEFRRNGLRLRVGADLGEIDQIGRDIVFGMFMAIPTVLIVTYLGARWVAQRAIAPVEAIRQAAAEITPQRLDKRLPRPLSDDEIAGLIDVLNDTFERLQRSFEQSKRFSMDASHQLKTPIAVLRAGIEEILTDPHTPPKQAARADALLHQIHQLTSISENLLLLARADAGRLELHPVDFDLREVLEGVLDDARALAGPLHLDVQAELPPALPVRADRGSVGLIAQSLFENAVKYSRPGGTLRVRAALGDEWAEVVVANQSEPIPPDQQAHIFERFFRARSAGATRGHGLGLAIARELAVAHGGDILLLRSDAEWTEFCLRLPRLWQEPDTRRRKALNPAR